MTHCKYPREISNFHFYVYCHSLYMFCLFSAMRRRLLLFLTVHLAIFETVNNNSFSLTSSLDICQLLFERRCLPAVTDRSFFFFLQLADNGRGQLFRKRNEKRLIYNVRILQSTEGIRLWPVSTNCLLVSESILRPNYREIITLQPL